jgi:molybdopterin-synthase adenylyltransferase
LARRLFASVTLAHTVSTPDRFSTSNARGGGRLQDYSRLERTTFAGGSLHALEAVVVGAGALGNEVAKALGLLGAGRVMVVDPDRVEPSNLTRSVFFRRGDFEGRNKASALVEAAGPLFPDTSFSAIEAEIADVGFGRLAGAGILFSCVDSDLARLEIAYISTKLGLPVADAGLGAPNCAHGRVSWFPGKTGACFGCKLTPRKRRNLLTFWDATVRPCSEIPADVPRPSTPTMAAIIGSLQVELGLRWLMGGQQESTTFEMSLEGDPRSEFFRTAVSPACPFHERPEEVMTPAARDSTLGQILESVKAPCSASACLALDWPICSRVRCLDCACEWAPWQRAAVVRRRCVCPSCGSRSILELESIRMISRGSPWAQQAPSAVGLPEDHWYTIRFHRGAG